MHILWHFDETFAIARKLGFSPCASYILGIGNMDVDLRHWDDEHWHGMTRANEKTGKLKETPEEAEEAFKKHLDDQRDKAKKQLSDGNCCKALFALGQALHGVQDREAHEGMTNPEHAVLELNGKSPDDRPAAKKAAKERTKEFIEDFLAGLSKAEIDALKHCECEECLKSVLQGPKGINMDLAGFKLVGLRFKYGRKKYDKVRWPKTTSTHVYK